MPPTALDGFVRTAPREFAAGWVPGQVAAMDPLAKAIAPRAASSPDRPVVALEAALLPALRDPPCVIGFSGGRDSSALLAVAVALARREGLELPVAYTKRYPGIPEADESQWQELVVRWVGLESWEQQDFTDELDLLGPEAQRSVRQHGALWPATLHNRASTLAVARGGWYVDGEGGDEILGPVRATPLARSLAARRLGGRRHGRTVARALTPAPITARVLAHRRRHEPTDRVWLQPEVADWYERTALEDEVRRPLRYAAALQHVARRRAVQVAMHNLDVMGRLHDVRYLHPLYDPSFLSSLGRLGGRLGFTSRAAAMRAVFGELLPEAVHARRDKAVFNAAFVGPQARDFLDQWDGGGVDQALVDTAVLGEMWSSSSVHAGTFQLLHAAWLAERGTQERSDGSGKVT